MHVVKVDNIHAHKSRHTGAECTRLKFRLRIYTKLKNHQSTKRGELKLHFMFSRIAQIRIPGHTYTVCTCVHTHDL